MINLDRRRTDVSYLRSSMSSQNYSIRYRASQFLIITHRASRDKKNSCHASYGGSVAASCPFLWPSFGSVGGSPWCSGSISRDSRSRGHHLAGRDELQPPRLRISESHWRRFHPWLDFSQTLTLKKLTYCPTGTDWHQNSGLGCEIRHHGSW